VVDDRRAAEYLVWPTHEQFEEGKFLRAELDLGLAAEDPTLGGIETEVANGEHDRTCGLPAPDERTQPGEELVEAERLGQVVIGTGVEPFDAVGNGASRSEEEDGHPAACRPKAPAHGKAIEIRQHHVEEHRVVGLLAGEPQPTLASHLDVDDVALLLKAAAEEGGHVEVVFDDEDSHRARNVPTSRCEDGENHALIIFTSRPK